MVTKEKTLLKQQEIIGGYDSTQYTSARIWAKAEDGVMVPISLVYKLTNSLLMVTIHFCCIPMAPTVIAWMHIFPAVG
jgi:protease II